MESEYIPKPIDISSVRLLAEIEDLVELLAEYAHDIWAAQRMEQGWVHGSQRCDKSKTHPCLVPYSDLPDSERQYDRNAATGTLKAIHAMGYSIVRSKRHNAEQGADDQLPARAESKAQ